MARAHALAPVPAAVTERGLDRIAPRVVGRADALVAETVDVALAYADVVRADAARFAIALDERGPLLGAE